MFKDRCTLSLNTSGDHLHRRGYRTHIGEAPLRETLSSSLLLASDALRYDLILDPMCGSGTFLIEAALLRRKLAPGLNRTFAFEHFPSFQASKWERFRLEAERAALSQSPARLIGCDIDEDALAAARANAERAGVLNDIHFFQADARTLDYGALKRSGESALLIANPPYGRRLGGEREVRALYTAFGERLSQAPGWNFAILTPELTWLSALKVERSFHFRNGGLQVYLGQGQSLIPEYNPL